MTVVGAPLVPGATNVRAGGSKLYRDAAALASSSMLTAVLGIGFWALCARLIPPATLGVQTALLSIITAPAIVVASGVGDAFTAIVPAAGRLRPAAIASGYRILLRAAVPLGLLAGVLAVALLPQVRWSVPIGALVAVGVVVWALFVVQDPALTSMRRAHWLPVENGSVSLVKIALLPVAIAVGVGRPAVVATLVPSVLAVAVLYPQVIRLARRTGAEAGTSADAGADAPADGAAGAGTHPLVGQLVSRTTASVAMSLGVLTATPFLVTAAAGPTQGAVFSLGLSIVQSLDFVGAALGVSLVVHAAPLAAEGGRMALAVFKRTAVVVGLGAVVLIVVTPFVLRMLNVSYVHLHGPKVVAILAVGSFGRTPYVIWAALQRSRQRMRTLLTLNAISAAGVLACIVPCAHRFGAVGAAAVIACAQVLLSIGAGSQLYLSRRRQVAR